MTRPGLLPCIGALLLLGLGHSAASAFTFCKGNYALCTSARCTAVSGRPGEVSCACEVKTGYSAGHDSCKPAKGSYVQSRYYPVKSLAVCNNDRPWANCLGKACTIDKNDPAKATCLCTTLKNQGPYVIVGDSITPTTCSTGIVSSATFAGHKAVTEFLEHTKLKPFHVEIVNPAAIERSVAPTSGTDAK
jgi:hypothetical protein